jgi:hypothetical protein
MVLAGASSGLEMVTLAISEVRSKVQGLQEVKIKKWSGERGLLLLLLPSSILVEDKSFRKKSKTTTRYQSHPNHHPCPKSVSLHPGLHSLQRQL